MARPRTLADHLADRDDHITILRLGLALLVLYSHAFALGGFGSELIAGGNDKYGNLAVNAFFALSGTLIAASYTRTRRVGRFFLNRCLRIFPGYWLALVVAALVICPLVLLGRGELDSAYWTGANGPFRFIVHNSALVVSQPTIDGLFSENPYPGAVNGVLWTLKYEFICYALVGFAGVAGLLRRHWGWPVALLALMGSNAAIHSGAAPSTPALASVLALVHFMAYFIAGVVAFIYADSLPVRARLAMAALTALVVLLLVRSPMAFAAYHALAPVLLAAALFGTAYLSPATRVERAMPDLSYGVYIYGWVVQQSLVALGIPRFGFAPFLLSCVAGTIALAAVSYYGVERRALQLKLPTASTSRTKPSNS